MNAPLSQSSYELERNSLLFPFGVRLLCVIPSFWRESAHPFVVAKFGVLSLSLSLSLSFFPSLQARLTVSMLTIQNNARELARSLSLAVVAPREGQEVSARDFSVENE